MRILCFFGIHDLKKTKKSITVMDRRFCADPKNHRHEVYQCSRCPVLFVRIGRLIKLGREYYYGM